MKRNYVYILIVLTLACIFLIIKTMLKENKPAIPPVETSSHSLSPFHSYITGIGIVQASSENIFIGTPINRIVEQVLVKVGMEVKKGTPLLKFENRDLESILFEKQIAYDITLAKLAKLEALPRQEDVRTAESALKSAQIDTLQARNELEMALSVEDTRAISQEEVNKRRYRFEQARSKEQQAEINLDTIKAGTWKPDIHIAQLETEQAKANLEKSKTDIERTVIRSPIDANVLQIKIHEGELPPADSSRNPQMIIGNTEEKYLLVSINQYNAPYFRSNAPAVAFLQGDNRVQFPLQFIRLEPYLVDKQNLSNDIADKVDTKVLNVIYSFNSEADGLFVGQQMDVFIEAQFAP